MDRTCRALCAFVLLLVAVSAQAAQSLAACYFNVYPVGNGMPVSGADPDFFVSEECCDTSPQAVNSVLGPNGLPWYRGGGTAAYPIRDVNAKGEITWWSPAFNAHVHSAGYGSITLPFKDVAMFPPQGQNPSGNDGSVRLTAVFSGVFTLSAPGPVTFSLGSDDDSFLYVDGNLVVAEEGVHQNLRVNATSGLLAAGRHIVTLFYADRQPAGASLTFSIVSPENLAVTPAETSLVSAAHCPADLEIPAPAKRPPRHPVVSKLTGATVTGDDLGARTGG